MDLHLNGDHQQFIKPRHYTIWQLIRTYWQSKERVRAYLMFALIMTMTIVLVGFDVVFNYWYNYFYNALQAYDMRSTVRLLFVFFGLATIYIIIAVYRYYFSQLFGLRWRRWLTQQFLRLWLNERGYYYLENFDVGIDNPEQRIQEDIATLVSNSIDLIVGLVGSVTTFFAFLYILWTLSGVLHIHLGGWVFYIPGYLVWVSLIYSFFGTLFTFEIGRPLIGLNFEQQRREATFRFAAMDLRSHAEDVALYRGEHHQKNILDKSFGRVLENWYLIILRQKLLLWYTSGYTQLAVVLPLVVVLPNYFEKIFLLGGLIQALRAFTSVQDSLSFLVNSYTQIALWQAIARRLTTFANHIDDAEKLAKKENHLTFQDHPENAIVTKQVSIQTPRKEKLLENFNQTFSHGRHYLIKGESGIGKSTLIKAIAGIWPYASGEIIFPKKKYVMFLPQTPYMPIGTLAEAVLFPDKDHPKREKEIVDALRVCHLENLLPRLHETQTWSEQLSPGEQQRLGFARVLLHKPDWIFLDESTSMLDITNEEHLYKLLKSRLPHCSIVSVGHRPSLDAYHDHVINIAEYRSEQLVT